MTDKTSQQQRQMDESSDKSVIEVGPPNTSSVTCSSATATSTPNRSAVSRKNSSGGFLCKKGMQTSSASDRLSMKRPSEPETGYIYSQRAFKKSSQNGKLTLYLANRDLIVTAGKIDKLQGVLLIDPEILQDKKVYGQVTLTFRYGREDEEVMGLKFFNEAIMALAQLYPPYYSSDRQEPTTAFQEVLMKRFHPNAHPFTISVSPYAPPSVQLIPAKEYNGAPIGTRYDVRIYAAEKPNEKLTRKMQVIRMGIRIIQGANNVPRNVVYGKASKLLPGATTTTTPATGTTSRSPLQYFRTRSKDNNESSNVSDEHDDEIKLDDADDDDEDAEPPIPQAEVEKQFLLSDGRVKLEASLDRAVYAHGEPITVRVNVTNNSGRSVKRIMVDIVQHVDVCMFSNGEFKNIVAQVSTRDGCPVEPGFSLERSYVLRPEKGQTKNWIALEDDPGYPKCDPNLAPTVVCAGDAPEDRNVFAIYVSYYAKVKVLACVKIMGDWIGSFVRLKLPFVLMHSKSDPIYTSNLASATMVGAPGAGAATDLAASPPHTPSKRTLDKIETVDEPEDDDNYRSLPFIDDKDVDTSDEDDMQYRIDPEDKKSAENDAASGLTLINTPIPTRPKMTVVKLTTTPSIETPIPISCAQQPLTSTILNTSSSSSHLGRKDTAISRRESMSRVDLIERFDSNDGDERST
ncbi:beta-arrestin-1-like [Trichogramma pretiosum]|uniref:beta-arrestin-1-like n=1 Tax=Trichogramma pretiosum TaxID=7493 RepID=UPI0006C96E5F|nr:beta-arrestin-1-like [Trichogramma pretiosum]XP_014223605.1 beta-arrestin-1-like [Trichogramma pretiosum]